MDSLDYPYPPEEAIIKPGLGILFTLLTCGIYGLYWQYKQMEILNAWLERDEYSFWQWFFLSIITCGLYAVYYEYKMAKGIIEIQEENDFRVSDDLPVICIILSIVGLSIASLAIQQSNINKFYSNNVPDF